MQVQFTSRATAALKRMLDEQRVEAGEIARMVTNIHGHHHLVPGRVEPDDQVVTHEGEPVLVIKKEISDHLCEHFPGATLDVEETVDGPALVMRSDRDKPSHSPHAA